MTLKRFPHYWYFVKRIQWSPKYSPHKGPVTRNFEVLFISSLNKLLNKQPIARLLKTLNLLKIEDIMKTKALKLYYRYKQNELPKYFESMFTESNDNHSHDTRHKSLLYQLPTKTSTGRLCIRHYIPELLSKTPECITEKLDTHSFSGFSNYMKKYYIRNYNENCLIENCYICQK